MPPDPLAVRATGALVPPSPPTYITLATALMSIRFILAVSAEHRRYNNTLYNNFY